MNNDDYSNWLPEPPTSFGSANAKRLWLLVRQGGSLDAALEATGISPLAAFDLLGRLREAAAPGSTAALRAFLTELRVAVANRLPDGAPLIPFNELMSRPRPALGFKPFRDPVGRSDGIVQSDEVPTVQLVDDSDALISVLWAALSDDTLEDIADVSDTEHDLSNNEIDQRFSALVADFLSELDDLPDTPLVTIDRVTEQEPMLVSRLSGAAREFEPSRRLKDVLGLFSTVMVSLTPAEMDISVLNVRKDFRGRLFVAVTSGGRDIGPAQIRAATAEPTRDGQRFVVQVPRSGMAELLQVHLVVVQGIERG